MQLLHLPRAILVLIITPLLTLLVSLFAIIWILVLRQGPEKAILLVRLWGKVVCALAGVPVTVNGLENVDPDAPCIFAANHQSMFDIIALQGFLEKDVRWLGKKELFRVPIWGRAMRLAGYIPIDRSHGRQAVKSLEEAARRIAEGTSVVIFPEGTRSLDGSLKPFKAGGMVLAIKSGVPIVPVGICGTFDILPKGRVLMRPGAITINIGHPIDTKAYTTKEKHELAEHLHDQVQRLLVARA